MGTRPSSLKGSTHLGHLLSSVIHLHTALVQGLHVWAPLVLGQHLGTYPSLPRSMRCGDEHKSRVWPIRVQLPSGYGDWFGERNVTQVQPITALYPPAIVVGSGVDMGSSQVDKTGFGNFCCK